MLTDCREAQARRDGAGLRRGSPDQAQLASTNDRLDPGLHAEMAAQLDQVLFHRPARQAEDAANVARALTLLHPDEALQLPIGDEPRRK